MIKVKQKGSDFKKTEKFLSDLLTKTVEIDIDCGKCGHVFKTKPGLCKCPKCGYKFDLQLK